MNSATSLISNAQQKASTAAQTIANLPVQAQEVGGSKDVGSADLFKPVLSLKEAELETSAGAKMIKVHEKTLGSLLDVTA
ncbi:hypothetical protein ACWAU0_10670 [Methylomonas sp. YC3]